MVRQGLHMHLGSSCFIMFIEEVSDKINQTLFFNYYPIRLKICALTFKSTPVLDGHLRPQWKRSKGRANFNFVYTETS